MSKTETNNEVRDDGGSSTDGLEVHECPIDGCSRIIVGNPVHLMTHVRESGDSAHRHRTLTTDLEVVVDGDETD